MNIEQLRLEVTDELTTHILPFWMNNMIDRKRGGFYGQMSGEGMLVPYSPKGAVLNARILWTFSAAYRRLDNPAYLETATRAKDYFLRHFIDKRGGVFWSLTYKGLPYNTKKQIYAIAFAIYGLAEYYLATRDEESLAAAIRLYKDVERHSFDADANGYIEACSRNWLPLFDMRLSERDANDCFTMNTHLHLLEAYTALYRIWRNKRLGERLCNLIDIFTTRIIHPQTAHLQLFFDKDWNSTRPVISYGHDIEASWLLCEAASALSPKLLSELLPTACRIAHAADEGLTSDGALCYETNTDTGCTDADHHWWVQAENVTGHYNLYRYTGDEDALQKAFAAWEYIKNHLIDRQKGEWFWSIRADGSVNTVDDKAGLWKCPYHNGRMCMEFIHSV
ncbi:MAG: AGE family epimerase/isomerase [Prevotellaceae bacterium]|jgi:mannobiose 2-epimerase|nr:AGE family epimerase/isomerase [Prevotellaceae bacterium]